ncbi:hypothetical protein HNY73_010074 [Argiope bruennichi]|uniref:Uncharacterized protein n=1 Tax=Argiope bruennichi TaxID=94029 RepID=A0A8T0EZU0_ARGBR|nr:hypothetical protein HNY73_010074 [Argiope bruennichi]
MHAEESADIINALNEKMRNESDASEERMRVFESVVMKSPLQKLMPLYPRLITIPSTFKQQKTGESNYFISPIRSDESDIEDSDEDPNFRLVHKIFKGTDEDMGKNACACNNLDTSPSCLPRVMRFAFDGLAWGSEDFLKPKSIPCLRPINSLRRNYLLQEVLSFIRFRTKLQASKC